MRKKLWAGVQEWEWCGAAEPSPTVWFIFTLLSMLFFTRLRRRIRRSALRLDLAIGVHRRRLMVRFLRHRKKFYLVAGSVLLVFAGGELCSAILRNRSELRAYAEALSASGILPQMGIAVGAAMLGVIGIVFSLSLFSIQQVAERGTTLTLREYANDRVLWIVYWSLAMFTLLAMAGALLKKESALYAFAASFAILFATIFLLKLYFNRTIKFSDPHFTVSKIAGRARRFLAQIRQMERAAETEMRYARRKGKF
jgi:uncharacterized membrane protein